VNRCTHEEQRLFRDEIGVIVRDGGIVCPKHGSIFDRCNGVCENGPAEQTTLQSIDITVEDGQVYLTDAGVSFLHAGSARDEENGDGPSSTSHLRF
jgi:nitrite reductase/ring-hydroxylating ferredoxin subunit